jgi:hypothetical protein
MMFFEHHLTILVCLHTLDCLNDDSAVLFKTVTGIEFVLWLSCMLYQSSAFVLCLQNTIDKIGLNWETTFNISQNSRKWLQNSEKDPATLCIRNTGRTSFYVKVSIISLTKIFKNNKNYLGQIPDFT